MIEYLRQPASHGTALAFLPEPVRRWFEGRHGLPTLIQRLAWPEIGGGRHLLLASPTGSGKTLAATLPMIGQFLAKDSAAGIGCLYLAPLRALCNDLRKNLSQALAEMGLANRITVGQRTGDTAGRERRQLLERPPHFLLTTPESLALLLSQPDTGAFFRGLRYVVVDEVHSLAGCKRGADLAISLERLSNLVEPEPQRIGLSATCSPIQTVAGWLAGAGRPVAAAAAAGQGPLEVRIEHLPPGSNGFSGSFLERVADRLAAILPAMGGMLVFANTRGETERLTWSLRRRLPDLDDQIAAHHSSLTKKKRLRVEEALRGGRLRIVVSSTSLELGIDIGLVDQVVLVHPPGGAVRMLQRLGRSGHRPGKPRRGLVFTQRPDELLETMATAAAGDAVQLEPIRVPRHPLDVLCQQLVSMSVARSWTALEAWRLVRHAFPYRELPLEDFVACLNYLSGGRPDVAVPPRLRWEDHQFGVQGRRTARIYRQNAGTILDEESRDVQREDGQPIGSVSEHFADLLQPGDRFLLDGRCLELTRGDGRGLRVQESPGYPAFTRWQGRLWLQPQALAERIWRLRARAAEALLEGPEALRVLLEDEYGLAPAAALELMAFLREQETQSAIPGDDLLVEVSPAGGLEQWSFHLPLCTAASEAVARVAAWRLARSTRLPIAAGCLGFTLTLAEGRLNPERIKDLLNPSDFERDFDQALSGSRAAGHRFQGAAETGLMLLRSPLGKKRKVGGRDWAGRRLFHWLRFADPAFPLLRQAQREVRDEVFAVEDALAVLRSSWIDRVRVRRLAERSPFASCWVGSWNMGQNQIARRQELAGNLGLASMPLFAGPQAPAGVPILDGDWMLTPERAAVHRPTATAVVADLHLGYEAVRRAAGEAVPDLGQDACRRRLERLIRRHSVTRLTVAGDLVEQGRQLDAVVELADWLDRRGVELCLVPGNHDRQLVQLPGLRIYCRGMLLGDWLVLHSELAGHHRRQVIGHVHPKVRLPGRLEKAPCFLVSDRQLILPAFSDDAAGINVRRVRTWRSHACFAVVDGCVRPLGMVGGLSEALLAGSGSAV